MRHLFRNDYSELCHINVINALEKVCSEQNDPYGLDKYSLSATNKIKKIFNCPESEVHFLAGGTQTNMTVISYILKDYEAVLACDTGHINVHETGAVEGSGHKVYTVNNKNGKLQASDVVNALKINNNEHYVKIKMVYISNATEIGTIYTKKELSDLYKVCKENNLYLYIDGARLGAALTSKENDIRIEEFASLCDCFYIGGTKNGLMIGEAVVINNKELQGEFRWQIKNKGAMLAKGYLLGIEFDTIFTDNLYFLLAKHSNEMGEKLKQELINLGLNVAPSPTNQIFVTMDKALADDLINEFGCELWTDLKEKQEIRFVTSFNTTEEDIKEVVNYIKEK